MSTIINIFQNFLYYFLPKKWKKNQQKNLANFKEINNLSEHFRDRFNYHQDQKIDTIYRNIIYLIDQVADTSDSIKLFNHKDSSRATRVCSAISDLSYTSKLTLRDLLVKDGFKVENHFYGSLYKIYWDK